MFILLYNFYLVLVEHSRYLETCWTKKSKKISCNKFVEVANVGCAQLDYLNLLDIEGLPMRIKDHNLPFTSKKVGNIACT
jgi:hypothetical protein